MYNPDTDLLFPSRLIPGLRGARGEEWKALVDQVSQSAPGSPDHLAFVLLMVRLSGCVSCNADSFRAMRGCTQCTRQTIRRFRGPDSDLNTQFAAARAEVLAALQNNGPETAG